MMCSSWCCNWLLCNITAILRETLFCGGCRHVCTYTPSSVQTSSLVFFWLEILDTGYDGVVHWEEFLCCWSQHSRRFLHPWASQSLLGWSLYHLRSARAQHVWVITFLFPTNDVGAGCTQKTQFSELSYIITISALKILLFRWGCYWTASCPKWYLAGREAEEDWITTATDQSSPGRNRSWILQAAVFQQPISPCFF